MKLEFLQEMAMMKRVSAGRNPYVVNMIGCCSIQEPLALVLELVPNGNLLEYLKVNRIHVRPQYICNCDSCVVIIIMYGLLLN